jgi:alpha-tubulin suppressor-like RCC1 family protein
MRRALSYRVGALAAPLLTAAAMAPVAASAPGTASAPAAAPPGITRAGAAAGPVVFTWGDNSAGELGNGTLTGTAAPAAVSGLAGVRTISAAGRHELALRANGTVLAWGDDTFGQLGNGIVSSNGDSEVPVAVPGLSTVTAVAAGEEHSLALLANGTVMAWGDNHEGQLGNGTTRTSAAPVPVQGLTGVTAIAAGSLFSLALLSDGTVMAWGDNREGQLGNGTLRNSSVPAPVKSLSGVTAIAAGALHSLAVLANGTAMAWGDNELGQLGVGRKVSLRVVPTAVAKISGITQIAGGEQHSVALLSDGSVWVWGDNGEFQLARRNGFPGGIGQSNVPLLVPGLGKAKAIAAGGSFSLAVVAGGKVRGWGDNAFGQLGNGGAETGPALVTAIGLAGAAHVVAGGVTALAFGPAATAARPAATAGPVSSPWRVAGNPPNPGGQFGLKDVFFSSVAAGSASDAWAVGASDALSTTSRPLAEHWDGNAWRTVAVPMPAGAAGAQLDGVDEVSSTNVWAVGTMTNSSGAERTLIEHFDGTAWAVVPSPNPRTGFGASDTLRGIGGTSPGDLWAVGEYTDGQQFNAMLFVHWNGTAWSFVKEPAALHNSAFGTAVTVLSPTSAWAVGQDGFADATLSAHWNGTAWSFVKTPFPQDGPVPQNFLTGVTATGPSDVWASGYEGNVDQQNFTLPYMLHWNGTAWALTKTPNAGTEGSQLNGVTAVSPADVWAAGQTGASDGALLTFTQHFNGRAWSTVPSLDPGELADAPDNTFQAIASVPPHTLFAVGSLETPTFCCLAALAERSTTG